MTWWMWYLAGLLTPVTICAILFAVFYKKLVHLYDE